MAMLCLLATARHIYFFVEQPASSLLELDPYFAFVIRTLASMFPMYRSFLCLGFIAVQLAILRQASMRVHVSASELDGQLWS